MSTNQHWRLLDWDYVCDQSPKIGEAHARASDKAEYGVNFYEFINTQGESLASYAQAWWDSLPKEKQQSLLWDRLVALQMHIGEITDAVQKYRKIRQ